MKIPLEIKKMETDFWDFLRKPFQVSRKHLKVPLTKIMKKLSSQNHSQDQRLKALINKIDQGCLPQIF